MPFTEHSNIIGQSQISLEKIMPSLVGQEIELKKFIIGALNPPNQALDFLYEGFPEEDKHIKFRQIPIDTGNGSELATFLCTEPIEVDPIPCELCDDSGNDAWECPDSIAIIVRGRNFFGQTVKITTNIPASNGMTTDIVKGNLPIPGYHRAAFKGEWIYPWTDPNYPDITLTITAEIESWGTVLWPGIPLKDLDFEMEVVIIKVFDSEPPLWLSQSTDSLREFAQYGGSLNLGVAQKARWASSETFVLFKGKENQSEGGDTFLFSVNFCNKIKPVDPVGDNFVTEIPTSTKNFLEVFIGSDLISRTFEEKSDENGDIHTIETRKYVTGAYVPYITVPKSVNYTTPQGDIISSNAVSQSSWMNMSQIISRNFPFPAPKSFFPPNSAGRYVGPTGKWDVWDPNSPYDGNPVGLVPNVRPMPQQYLEGYISSNIDVPTGYVGFYWVSNFTSTAYSILG